MEYSIGIVGNGFVGGATYLLKHKNNSWNFSSTPSTSSTFDELSTKTTTPLGVVVFVVCF